MAIPNLSRSWMLVAAAALVAAVLMIRGRGTASSPGQPEIARLDFKLKDMHGATVDLASLKGRPLLINVWATYCGPCKIETPDLVTFYEKYKDNGFMVLGISFEDSPKDLLEFASTYKITYPILVGDGHDDLRAAYQTIGIPTSWFVKRDGTINETQVGIGSTDDLEKKIRALF